MRLWISSGALPAGQGGRGLAASGDFLSRDFPGAPEKPVLLAG
jgi:hypothetical protein